MGRDGADPGGEGCGIQEDGGWGAVMGGSEDGGGEQAGRALVSRAGLPHSDRPG